MTLTGEVIEAADPQVFADAINTEWRKSLEGIFAVGRMLIEAKARLPHGEFGRMFRDSFESVDRPVPFGQDAADRYMAIASAPVLANSDFSRNLPASYQTLYLLRDISEDEMTALIDEGRVRPDMTQADARALRAKEKPTAKERPWTAAVVKAMRERPKWEAELGIAIAHEQAKRHGDAAWMGKYRASLVAMERAVGKAIQRKELTDASVVVESLGELK